MLLVVPAPVTAAMADIGEGAAYVAGSIVLAFVVIKCIKILGSAFIFRLPPGRPGQGDGMF